MKKTWLASLMALCMQASLSLQAAEVPTDVALDASQQLVKGNGAEPTSLDPQLVRDAAGQHIMVDLFEGLVAQDRAGNTIAAGATDWDVADNRIFTFHLRKNALWSDGKPVTAHDYTFAFRRAVDPRTASPYAWYIAMPGVLNARAIVAGEKPASTLGVRALDDYTFQIRLERPLSFFLQMLTYPTTYPVPRHVVQEYGKAWIRPGRMVSNGAYVLKDWVVNEKIVLARNQRYWNNSKTVVNRVTFLPLTAKKAELNRYRAGELDMTSSAPPPQHLEALRKTIPEEIRTSPLIGTYFYSFNTRRPPFNDVRVRKALAYAIDRDLIAGKLLGRGEIPAYGLLPGVVAGASRFEPAWARLGKAEREQKARELLKAAGYDRNSRPLSLTLFYNTDDVHKQVGLAIAQMWQKVLGVRARLRNQEWKVLLDTLQRGQFDIGRRSWLADYNEAFSMLALFATSNDANYARFSDSQYDSLLNKAMLEADPVLRKNLYTCAERILSDSMPIAPIYHYVTGRLVKSHVGGYPDYNPLDRVYSKDLYIVKHS